VRIDVIRLLVSQYLRLEKIAERGVVFVFLVTFVASAIYVGSHERRREEKGKKTRAEEGG
jgi:hypothetical protein